MGGLGNSSLELTGIAGDPASPVHRLDPRAKLLGFIGLTVVAVTAPLSSWPVWVACASVLVLTAAIAGIGPRTVWRRARLVLPLVLFVGVFIPFARTGEVVASLGPFDLTREGIEIWLAASAKATIGTVSAVMLGATTAYPQVLRGLEALRVPRTLTMIAAFMYRYLFVIVDEVQRMRAARDARGYRPRTMFGAGAAGRIASALFLRTHARGERVYLAMLARGYDGRMRHLVPLTFGRADALFVAAFALVLLPLRVIAWSCAIHARAVSHRYPNGHLALDGVDLHVPHGQRIAVLGPNGAGKTTLMLRLNGLLLGEGEIEVAGIRVGPKTLRDARRNVGLIFQDPDDQLFMPTVREDVAFGPLNMGLERAEVERRVAAALDAVRMGDVVDRAPHELSLGQRRRVAIATVLAMEPTLLVLDEPSANLDPRSRRELLDVLETIERTLVVVTHDLPFAAELCERAVILARGRLVADGYCCDVLADGELLASHDLELPRGFVLERIPLRGRPGDVRPVADGTSVPV